MTNSFSPEHQLKAFINTAQYFAGLTSGQDIWAESGKILVKFFGADVAAFGKKETSGKIEIVNRALSLRGAAAQLPEPDITSAVNDVFESGFLTFLSFPGEDPAAAAFFPVFHGNLVIAVMVVGHLSSRAMAKETLDLYLAVAGLIGATYSRTISESAVLQAKEDWERTFEAVPDLIALLDLDHRIVRANKAMAERLGMTREECVGIPCYRAVHGLNDAPPYCPFCKVLADGMEHSVEICEERLCGNFLMSASPLHDKSGSLIGGVIVARDITALKRSEKALQAETAERILAIEDLREKEYLLMQQSRMAAMGEMIGNIAHQWRQPLNILGLMIQQMLIYYDLGEFDRGFLNQNVVRSMELIKHMSQTIDDFRNYFRPDKDKTVFSVNDTVTNTMSLIEDSFRNQHINVAIVAMDDPVVNGYRNEFAQALLNILNNARDALTGREVDKPGVTITISSDDGAAVVTVSDNAGGIPEEIIGKIFDPYFTTKGPQQGTGVGLFMSKAIIEKNMGGRLSVRNIAYGAEFRIEVHCETPV
jgi:PAS domain S-box-containing protein